MNDMTNINLNHLRFLCTHLSNQQAYEKNQVKIHQNIKNELGASPG